MVIDFEPSNFIYGELGDVFCNLETLRIISQSIELVERSNFANLDYLQELSLFRNPIEFLPEDVFWDLPSLEELNLCNCRIKVLPGNVFKNLKELTSIILSDNRLTKLPGNLFENNIKLREISLENNKIVRIDVDFSKLHNLRWLNLEGNECIDDQKERNIQDLQKIINLKCQKNMTETN